MKKINLILLGSLLTLKLSAQQELYTISDSLLNYESNVINHKTAKIKLSDFNDKLVILDVWSTTCVACIEGFPTNDSLQKAFKGKIQFIQVNPKFGGDNQAKITKFFKAYKAKYPKFSMPCIMEDTVITKKFKRQYIPYYIWINKGKFLGITTHKDVNASKIKSIIDGNETELVNAEYFTRDQPLFKNVNIYKLDNPKFQSNFFWGSIAGIGSGTTMTEAGNTYSYTLRNFSVADICNFLYGVRKNQLLFLVGDYSKYISGNSDPEVYTYELLYPATVDQKMRDKIISEDIIRFSNLAYKLENRDMKCWILKFNNEKLKKSLLTSDNKSAIEEQVVALNGAQNEGGPLFINETHLDTKIDNLSLIPRNVQFITKRGAINDIIQYKKFLNKIGFDVVEEVRNVKMVVISEKNFNNLSKTK